jgi:hypothetical protein
MAYKEHRITGMFKVGDTVRVVNPDATDPGASRLIGQEGVIQAISDIGGPWPIKASIADPLNSLIDSTLWREDELVLVSRPSTEEPIKPLSSLRRWFKLP